MIFYRNLRCLRRANKHIFASCLCTRATRCERQVVRKCSLFCFCLGTPEFHRVRRIRALLKEIKSAKRESLAISRVCLTFWSHKCDFWKWLWKPRFCLDDPHVRAQSHQLFFFEDLFLRKNENEPFLVIRLSHRVARRSSHFPLSGNQVPHSKPPNRPTSTLYYDILAYLVFLGDVTAIWGHVRMALVSDAKRLQKGPVAEDRHNSRHKNEDRHNSC